MKKILGLVIVIIIVILIIRVSSSGTPKPASTSQESIKIGAALALTGDAAVWGEAAKNGIELAVKEINASAGQDSASISLVTEDTRSSSKDTVSAVSKLQNVDKVNALIVSWLDVYQGAESVLKPNTLMISPDAGTEGVNGTKVHTNVFSTWYRTQPKSELAVKHMAAHGVKKLYIIVQNDSYYVSAVGFTEAAAKKYGIEVVGKDMLSEGTDMQTILTKAAAKKPDAVFVALYDEKQNVDFLKKHGALLGATVKVYGDEFIQQNYNNTTSYNPQWFEGFYFYTPKQANTAFVEKYKAAYGKDPIFGASTAYDSVYMIAKALKDKPADLNSYMRATKFATVSYGEVTFDEIGGISTLESYFVIKQVQGGATVVSE